MVSESAEKNKFGYSVIGTLVDTRGTNFVSECTMLVLCFIFVEIKIPLSLMVKKLVRVGPERGRAGPGVPIPKNTLSTLNKLVSYNFCSQKTFYIWVGPWGRSVGPSGTKKTVRYLGPPRTLHVNFQPDRYAGSGQTVIFMAQQ